MDSSSEVDAKQREMSLWVTGRGQCQLQRALPIEPVAATIIDETSMNVRKLMKGICLARDDWGQNDAQV